ncbi:uncharacterized protein LOC142803101 [Rhipicephalus microplus]|uniref:uncharacterized protein LOC142803101 n=1 Tax=Rhipicephalus microplus TaxID=6941 RepID=UPI003F6A7B6D
MGDQYNRTHVETVPTCGAAHACRICHHVLGCLGDPLVEPCACRGPNAFVHKSCLERWLRERDTLECDICHKPFMVLFKNAPLLDFFKDPDHRVDVLRMVVDAVSAAGDALVLSFAWAYASAILGATGWTLYLLILFVMMFQTAFWSGVEVIRVFTCYEPVRTWRKRTASLELVPDERGEPAGDARLQNRPTSSEKKKVSLISPATSQFVTSSTVPLSGQHGYISEEARLQWLEVAF